MDAIEFDPSDLGRVASRFTQLESSPCQLGDMLVERANHVCSRSRSSGLAPSRQTRADSLGCRTKSSEGGNRPEQPAVAPLVIMPTVRASRIRSPLALVSYLSVCSLGLVLPYVGGCSRDAEADVAPSTAPPTETSPSAGSDGSFDYDPRKSLAPLIERVGPTVVSIEVESKPLDDRIFGLGSGRFQHPRASGRGSGFIFRADGLVVTNHHVVDGARDIAVVLPGGTRYPAELIGSDAPTDLAVVRIETPDELPAVELGSSNDLKVGDWVVAIGNPMGLDHSASVGILSGRGRGSLGLYPDSYLDFLQTDADIAPGSSGGPLFDLRGRVIGINTAVGGTNGPGFAIPVDQASGIIAQLVEKGSVTRGWLGAGSMPGEPKDGRAVIGSVYRGTPAAQAGLRAGDVVVKVDGTPIASFDELRAAVAQRSPGHTALLEVERAGQRIEIAVVLERRPDSSELDDLRSNSPGGGSGLFDGWLSPPKRPFGPPPTPDASAPDSSPSGRLGVRAEPTAQGLSVVSVESGSLAEDLGLRPGDVIERINGQAIAEPEDVRRALSEDARRTELEFTRDAVKHQVTLERS